LVGTIIVVAIAVIFLPNLLDGKQESERNLFVELPQNPPMKEVQAPQPFDANKVKEAATRKVEVISEQAVDDVEITTETNIVVPTEDVKIPDDYVEQEPVVAVKPDTRKSPSAGSLEQQTVVEQDVDRLLASAGWVVQLGSFRHQKNVQELLNRLEKAGYRAFSRPVKTNSGTLTKVFVGPDLQKGNLEDALSHLKELTQLQGRVTPFTVQ
jgi:DedD protein